MRPRALQLVMTLAVARDIAAQNPVTLKAWIESPPALTQPAEFSIRKSLRPNRHYRIVQLHPSWPDWDRLRNSGALEVERLSGDAAIVVTPEGWTNDGLPLTLSRLLGPRDKSSPVLDGVPTSTAAFVVQFFSDVGAGDARGIILTEGLTIREHPDLMANHLLVEGIPDRLRSLTEWDEVAYVFPAAPELIQGHPVRACPGAVTPYGLVGHLVGKVGDGWDGPGRNPATLTYNVRNLTSKLDTDSAVAEIKKALAEWSRAVQVDFEVSPRGDLPRHIQILFASGTHGDAYPFDGPGRILAHTFYPAPPNPEPIAGDLHLDGDESWRIGQDTDIYTVVLHELGHALGLGHSDTPGAVMYPYYRRAGALTPEDIHAIRDLYAARDQPGPGAPPPPRPEPRPPVEPPVPPPAPPPAPPPNPETDRTSPSLTITSPPVATLLTFASSITLRGSATDNVSVREVVWSTSVGRSGVAQGTTAWSAEVPLLVGVNRIVVRAFDSAGNSGWRSVVVRRQ